MRKVVLETKNENALRKLARRSRRTVWARTVDRTAENVPPVFGTRPYRRRIGGYFKKCNLAKVACVAPTAK